MLIPVSVASAATPPVGYWTTAQAQAMLVSKTITTYQVGHGLTNWTTARCHGLGKTKAHAYTTFSCAVSRPSPNVPTISQSTTLFVRPWSTNSVCVTDISLGSCPPPKPAHPKAGDPRACSTPDQAQCVGDAVTAAMTRTLAGSSITPIGLSCQAGTAWTSYTCTWRDPTGGHTGTVVLLLLGGRWTVKTAVTS